MRDSDGLLRAFRRTYVFRGAGGDVRRVQLWNPTRGRVTPDGMSQTWSDKLRAGRQSLCGGDAASSTPRGGGVAARNSE